MTKIEEKDPPKLGDAEMDEHTGNDKLWELLSKPDSTSVLSLTDLPIVMMNAMAQTKAFGDYIKYCVQRAEYNTKTAEEKEKTKLIKPKPMLIEDAWIDYYCRLRMSKNGDNKMQMVTLGRDQLAAQEQDNSLPRFNLSEKPRL